MMKTRYNFIKSVVNKLFLEIKISSYPIETINLFSHFTDCRVVSYSKHMKKYNLTEKEVIEHFGSDEGCTVYSLKKRRYIVFYNDLVSYYKKPERRNWTIAHELGHILLDHFTITNKTKIFRNNLSDEEYKWMESEANRFASLLLANPIILYKLKITSVDDIIGFCNVSYEAATYRLDDYYKWLKYKYMNNTDYKILSQFHTFINKKVCPKCHYDFISENAQYCPICSYSNLVRGDGDMLYDDGFDLDDKSRATQCPKCENEQIAADGCYCRICGTYLINKCTNNDGIWDYDRYGNQYLAKDACGMIAKGNARFCELCGQPTTFYRQAFLKKWEEAKEIIRNKEIEEDITMYSDMDDIPF